MNKSCLNCKWEPEWNTEEIIDFLKEYLENPEQYITGQCRYPTLFVIRIFVTNCGFKGVDALKHNCIFMANLKGSRNCLKWEEKTETNEQNE